MPVLTRHLPLLTGVLTFAAASGLFLAPASAQNYDNYDNRYDPGYYPGNNGYSQYPNNNGYNQYPNNSSYNQPGVFSGNSALSGVVSTVVSGLINRTLSGGNNAYYPNTPYNSGYYPPNGYGQGVPYNNSAQYGYGGYGQGVPYNNSAQYGYGGYGQAPYGQPNNAANGLVTSVVGGLLNQVLRSR